MKTCLDQGLAEQDVGRLDHGQTLGLRIKFDGAMDAGAAKTRPARRGSLLDELITKAGV